jgi:hypothetical protein
LRKTEGRPGQNTGRGTCKTAGDKSGRRCESCGVGKGRKQKTIEVLAKCLAIHVEKAVLRDSQFIFYRKLGFSS